MVVGLDLYVHYNNVMHAELIVSAFMCILASVYEYMTSVVSCKYTLSSTMSWLLKICMIVVYNNTPAHRLPSWDIPHTSAARSNMLIGRMFVSHISIYGLVFTFTQPLFPYIFVSIAFGPWGKKQQHSFSLGPDCFREWHIDVAHTKLISNHFPPQNALLSSIQHYLRRRIGLWENYCYTLCDSTPYFPSDLGFTNIVVWSIGTVWCENEVQSTKCARTIEIKCIQLTQCIVFFYVSKIRHCTPLNHLLNTFSCNPMLQTWSGRALLVIWFADVTSLQCSFSALLTSDRILHWWSLSLNYTFNEYVRNMTNQFV